MIVEQLVVKLSRYAVLVDGQALVRGGGEGAVTGTRRAYRNKSPNRSYRLQGYTAPALLGYALLPPRLTCEMSRNSIVIVVGGRPSG